MDETTSPSPIILYDPDCALCQRFKQAIEHLETENSFQFISVHEPATYERFSELSYEECLKEIHLIEKVGHYIKGKEAIEFIVKKLPAAQKFIWLLDSNVGQKSLDFFHQMSNKYREKIKHFCPGCPTHR